LVSPPVKESTAAGFCWLWERKEDQMTQELELVITDDIPSIDSRLVAQSLGIEFDIFPSPK